MPSIYSALIELEINRQSAALCTVVKTSGSTPRHSTSKMLVYPDGHIIGTVGGGELENRVRQEAKDSLMDGKPRLLTYNMSDPEKGDVGICGGQVEVFVEPILPYPTIVIIGGGHVGKAVAHLAKWTGYYVIVSDDREEFCSPETNPDASAFICCQMSELPGKMDITRSTCLILTTRGNQLDVEGLPSLLKSRAGYIGIIGSKRRWADTVRQIKEKGVSEPMLRRVHSPIGLRIGAETPEEIAISIMAQVVQVLHDTDKHSNRE
jgi:xanthine dehydrogenase accessory factor